MSRGPYVIEHGDVWNVAGGTPGNHVCRGSGLMAIAYCPVDDIAFKHGGEERVTAWANAQRDAGMELEVVSFPPTPETIDALNDLAAGLGGPSHLIGRFVRLSDERPELSAIPAYPR